MGLLVMEGTLTNDDGPGSVNPSPEMQELDTFINAEYQQMWGKGKGSIAVQDNVPLILSSPGDSAIDPLGINGSAKQDPLLPPSDSASGMGKQAPPHSQRFNQEDLPHHLMNTIEGEGINRQTLEASEAGHREEACAWLREATTSSLGAMWADLITAEKKFRTATEDVMYREWYVILQIRDEAEEGNASGDAMNITSALERGSSQDRKPLSEREEALQATVTSLRGRNADLEVKLRNSDTADVVRLREELRLAQATIQELRGEVKALHLLQQSQLQPREGPPPEAIRLAPLAAAKPSTPRLNLGALPGHTDRELEEQRVLELRSRSNKDLAKRMSLSAHASQAKLVPVLDIKTLSPVQAVRPSPDMDLDEQLVQESRSRSNRVMAKNASMRLAPIEGRMLHDLSGFSPITGHTDNSAEMESVDSSRNSSFARTPTGKRGSVVSSLRPRLSLALGHAADESLEEQIGMEGRSRSNRNLAKCNSMSPSTSPQASMMLAGGCGGGGLTPRLNFGNLSQHGGDDEQVAMEVRSRSNRNLTKNLSVRGGGMNNLSPITSQTDAPACPTTPRGR